MTKRSKLSQFCICFVKKRYDTAPRTPPRIIGSVQRKGRIPRVLLGALYLLEGKAEVQDAGGISVSCSHQCLSTWWYHQRALSALRPLRTLTSHLMMEGQFIEAVLFHTWKAGRAPRAAGLVLANTNDLAIGQLIALLRGGEDEAAGMSCGKSQATWHSFSLTLVNIWPW